jgi:hypothetical protein
MGMSSSSSAAHPALEPEDQPCAQAEVSRGGGSSGPGVEDAADPGPGVASVVQEPPSAWPGGPDREGVFVVPEVEWSVAGRRRSSESASGGEVAVVEPLVEVLVSGWGGGRESAAAARPPSAEGVEVGGAVDRLVGDSVAEAGGGSESAAAALPPAPEVSCPGSVVGLPDKVPVSANLTRWVGRRASSAMSHSKMSAISALVRGGLPGGMSPAGVPGTGGGLSTTSANSSASTSWVVNQ